MITKEQFDRGVLLEDELKPIDVLKNSGMAMTTKEITAELQKRMPGAGITYGSVKQRLAKDLKNNLVERKKVEGKNYWKNSDQT